MPKYTSSVILNSTKPNFERDLFDTLDDLLAFSLFSFPSVFYASVKDTGKTYKLDKNNHSKDPVMGYWREVTGGSGDGTQGADGKSAYELYVDSLPKGETPLPDTEWLTSDLGQAAYNQYAASVPAEETPLTEEEWLADTLGQTAYQEYVESLPKAEEPLSLEEWLLSLNGKSAYEIYLTTVPEGDVALSEEEWLASLKGKDGNSINIKADLESTDLLPTENIEINDSYLIDGNLWVYTASETTDEKNINGFTNVGNIQGPEGKDGKSAYQIYVDSLPKGEEPLTEEEWLANDLGQTAYLEYLESVSDEDIALSEEEWLANDLGQTAYLEYLETVPKAEEPLTEEEWLESLKGYQGIDGKSAYDLYKDSIPEDEEPLSEEEWLAALKGEQGKSAYEVYLTTVPEDETPLTEEEWLASLKAPVGDLDIITDYEELENSPVVTGEEKTIIIANTMEAPAGSVVRWNLLSGISEYLKEGSIIKFSINDNDYFAVIGIEYIEGESNNRKELSIYNSNGELVAESKYNPENDSYLQPYAPTIYNNQRIDLSINDINSSVWINEGDTFSDAIIGIGKYPYEINEKYKEFFELFAKKEDIDLSGTNTQFQFTEMPDPFTFTGVAQYIGITNDKFTHGYFYEPLVISETEATWTVVSIQPTNKAADASSVYLTESIAATVDVGGLSAGTVLDPSNSIEDILKKILYKYVPANITISIEPSTEVYETGTMISSLTLTIKTFKTVDNIEYVKVTQKNSDGTTVDILNKTVDEDPLVANTNTYTVTVENINSDVTFTATVNDGTESNKVSKSLKFVNPTYWGVSGSAAITEESIETLTSKLQTSSTDTISVTSSNQYIVYITTKTVKSIIDKNGFDNMDSFTKSTVLINSIMYNCYVSNTAVTCTDFSYTIKF